MTARPELRDPFREGPDAARARKLRSMGIAVLLVGFAALVFVISVIRMRAGG